MREFAFVPDGIIVEQDVIIRIADNMIAGVAHDTWNSSHQ